MPTEFGPFTFDPARHLLIEDGAEVHLSRKAFSLLELLLAQRPNVVTKETLHRQIWPDVFVTDSTLNSLVAEVRAALGEEARGGHFIRTVHGVGYAFAGEARPSDPERSPPPPPLLRWLEQGGERLPLHAGANAIGRGRKVDVFIDHPSVSRGHARLVVAGDGASIEDTGSKNGTFVEGRRVDGPASLHDGCRILIGAVLLTFRSADEPPSTASVVRPAGER